MAWKGTGKGAARRAGDVLADESGQTVAYMAIVSVVVLLVAAFAIDLSMANITRTRQADMLQQSVAKCLEPASSVKLKNSDNPGRDLGELLTGFLRDAGYGGEVEVFFYEPDRVTSGLDDDKRAYAFGARLHSKTATVFGIAQGLNAIDSKIEAYSYSTPYAFEKVYRPPLPIIGTYRAGADSRAGTWQSYATLSPLDGDVQEKLEAKMQDALRQVA